MDAKNNVQESPILSEPENQNKTSTVEELYKALASGDVETVSGVLDSDLEYWFHGPQNCEHMMRVFTGQKPNTQQFIFKPRSITAIDDRVIVEGWEGAKAYWVHVWTLKDGLITQFREYFNTWLTVTEFLPMPRVVGNECRTLWKSHPGDLAKRSLPGLMLAI